MPETNIPENPKIAASITAAIATITGLQPEMYDDQTGVLINKDKPDRRKTQLDRLSENLSVPAWGGFGKGLFTAVTEATRELEPGAYSFFKTNSGLMIKHTPINSDELLLTEDYAGYKLIKEIEEFWNLGEVFEKFGFLHRRGYLLSGPPGGGKTCLIKMVADACIKQNALVLMPNRYNLELLPDVIRMIRVIEPTRRIVCIFEDVEEFGETELLSYLDGEDVFGGIINLATTNHLEDLPPRLTARPRRFDRILKIGLPNPKMRRQYFKSKVPGITEDRLEELVTASEEFSFAAMADLVVSVYCLNKSVNDAAQSLKALQSIQTF